MAAIITRHGNLSHQGHDDPSVATLDLLRAYAHDSLHYASYRIYQWAATSGGPQMTRTRYGINFRRADGRTYSAPDPADSPTTRNLGIIMEGATDREARLITHTTADLASIRSPATAPDSLTYRDITGQLTATDLTAPALATPARAIYRAFLARMASYQRTVGSRYESFLRDASPDAPDELHDLILTAMISGTLTHLSQRLNNRYGVTRHVGGISLGV